jgi:mRNA interferase MazF
MKRGDVFDARLNPTEGSEQAGIRPVIVVSRDAINQYSSVIVVAPVTSAHHVRRDYPNNLRIQGGLGGLAAESVVLGGQIRAIAKTRLLRQRGTLPSDVMVEIDRILKITLDL